MSIREKRTPHEFTRTTYQKSLSMINDDGTSRNISRDSLSELRGSLRTSGWLMSSWGYHEDFLLCRVLKLECHSSIP
jgi:hypothetical protein